MGAVAVYQPFLLLAVSLASCVGAAIWVRPALAAYLLIGLTPLVAGIDRGVAIPVFRPNEALELLLAGVLLLRWLVGLRSGDVRLRRPDVITVAILLLALTNSVTPLATMAVRGQPITMDDLQYSVVLWKLMGVYLVVKASVRTERETRTCLLVSLASGCVVGIVGILQGLDLLGVRVFLARHFAQFGDAASITTIPRGGSTLSLPAAVADLMIMNLAIATTLWLRTRKFTWLFGATAGLLIFATLAAGEFSSTIGLVLGMIALAVATRSFRLMGLFAGLGAVGVAAVWPVISTRLSGFTLASGLPVSWVGRLRNLTTYFWPVLFSDKTNVVLGVRPSARVPVARQATGWVWIESGYTWLLWGGGIPLLVSYLFFCYVVGRRGWWAVRNDPGSPGVAGAAVFVAVVVIAVLMVFDPHITYRGSADEFFALIALMAGAHSSRGIPGQIPWYTSRFDEQHGPPRARGRHRERRG